MKAGLAWCLLLSGCALHPMEPVRSLAGATPDPLPLGIAQIGHGAAAVFSLCEDCPVSTRKVLAPSLPPIRLADAAKAQPLTTPQQPKEERITRAVHFCFASSKLTPEAHGALVAMRPLLQMAKSITLTGHTDRVGAPNFNSKLASRRAETVRDALLAVGISPDRVHQVKAECCVEDPPRVNPAARRTDVEILVVRPAP